MHYKKLVKPDSPYFGEQDFAAPDETITVTIESYAIENVTNNQGTKLKGVLHFSEKVKPLILNSTNGSAISKLYGKETDGWIGKQITLYLDPNVRFAGKRVGGTRVRKPSAIPDKALVFCESCGCGITAYGRMSAEEMADYTKNKYGQSLCTACAMQAAQSTKEDNNADE